MESEATTAAAGIVRRAALEIQRRPYVRVFGALAVMTLVEFQIPFISTDVLSKSLQIVFLLAFAITKASMVVAYYMHLRYEPRILAYIPLVPLILIAGLVATITLR